MIIDGTSEREVTWWYRLCVICAVLRRATSHSKHKMNGSVDVDYCKLRARVCACEDLNDSGEKDTHVGSRVAA